LYEKYGDLARPDEVQTDVAVGLASHCSANQFMYVVAPQQTDRSFGPAERHQTPAIVQLI
jgi:hypothetical protein